jgi:hypothetical protein
MLVRTERLSRGGGRVRDLTGPRCRARPRLRRHGWLRRHEARMSCRENGAENLKCRHHFERCLATSSHKLALSFGCADKGLSGVGRQCFYLALLIACRAFAHVCSIIWSGKRTAASFRWFPRPQRPRAADNLAFAGRFDATVIDQKMGLDDKELAFGSSPGLLPKGQRRGLSGYGRTYRRLPRGSGIPSPPAARFGYCRQQLRGHERGTPRG